MRLVQLLLLFVLPLPTQAVMLKAEARAATEQQAKSEALAALADSIFVNVQSEYSSYVEGNGKRQDAMRISSRSDIPLIGVDISVVKIGADVVCIAQLDGSKSLAIYEAKLNELLLEINAAERRVSNTNESERYDLLVQLLTTIEQYEKYRAVGQLLGTKQLAPPRTRAEVETQLRALEKSSFSIDLAAQVLLKGLKAPNVFVYPATPHGSHEVTSFGRLMRDSIAQHLIAKGSPAQAQTFFKGEYEILDNSIHLTYRLLDILGNTLEIRLATLASAAYQGIQVKPSTLDFDRLLHEGVAVSDDFRVQINTDRGSENIAFDEQDQIQLLVKLSRPGYFYVVGHAAKKLDNYSYLLELNDADNDRRFIRFVNADDVNKWLSIGSFTVTAPFGVESVQLVASKDDPIKRLPPHPFDKKFELYVLANNAEQGINKTRALKPKRSKTDELYQAEAVLMFTTLPKSDNK